MDVKPIKISSSCPALVSTCPVRHSLTPRLFLKIHFVQRQDTAFVFLAVLSSRHTSVAMRLSDQAMIHLKQLWHLWVPSMLKAWQKWHLTCCISILLLKM
jgi:hypothetical protein